MLILVIDIETTGFQNVGGKIVEIGVVTLDLDNGEIVPVFNSVCHERPITKEEVEKSWIVSHSDLTVEMIRHSPQLNKLRDGPEGLQTLFNDYKEEGATAYNRKFDFNFLENRKFVMPKALPCPMLELTPVMKLPNPKFGGSYKWPSVQEAYDFLFPNSGYIEKHRALDDAIHEAQIVYEAFKRGYYKLKS